VGSRAGLDGRKISSPPGFFYCLLFNSIYITSIVTSVLHSYIHTSLLSGPASCICTLTLFYYVWLDIVFLLDLLLRVRVSLRLPYLVTSVLAHVVVCVRRACFGVNDCFCMVVITVACLGPSGSLPLAFSELGAGTTSTSILSRNPSAIAGFVKDLIPDRPAPSQSVYRLSYPAHQAYLNAPIK